MKSLDCFALYPMHLYMTTSCSTFFYRALMIGSVSVNVVFTPYKMNSKDGKDSSVHNLHCLTTPGML